MSTPISPVRMISLPETAQLGSASQADAAPGAFGSMLEGMIGRVEQSQTQAQQAAESFLDRRQRGTALGRAGFPAGGIAV